MDGEVSSGARAEVEGVGRGITESLGRGGHRDRYRDLMVPKTM